MHRDAADRAGAAERSPHCQATFCHRAEAREIGVACAGLHRRGTRFDRQSTPATPCFEKAGIACLHQDAVERGPPTNRFSASRQNYADHEREPGGTGCACRGTDREQLPPPGRFRAGAALPAWLDQLQHLRPEPPGPPFAIQGLQDQLGRCFEITLLGAGAGTAIQLFGLGQQALALLTATMAIAGSGSGNYWKPGAWKRRGGRETGHRSCGGRQRKGLAGPAGNGSEARWANEQAWK